MHNVEGAIKCDGAGKNVPYCRYELGAGIDWIKFLKNEDFLKLSKHLLHFNSLKLQTQIRESGSQKITDKLEYSESERCLLRI